MCVHKMSSRDFEVFAEKLENNSPNVFAIRSRLARKRLIT